MIEAVTTMAGMGLGLGVVLGLAAKWFRIEGNPVVDDIETIMPGTNCGQCGYPGCRPAAEALVEGTAPVTLCPPGGRALAAELAERLGVEADLTGVADAKQLVAFIFEDQCTGCTKCFKRCPTDAIIGASHQIHTVINDACIGCMACVEACPTKAVIVRPMPETLQTWHWSKPVEDHKQARAKKVAA